MSNGLWTDAENDLIVADYIAMLPADLAGQSDSEAANRSSGHNRWDPLLDRLEAPEFQCSADWDERELYPPPQVGFQFPNEAGR